MQTKRAAALLLLLIGIGACTGGGGTSPNGTLATAGAEARRGGTLRVAIPKFTPTHLDPTGYTSPLPFELFRCCLLRTLYSYNGRPADQGGSVARPDLAAGMPQVSSDGLVWTIRLKEGLHYAPPFQSTEIVASDVVRALEREANPLINPPAKDIYDSYVFYYRVIQGLDEFWKGKASSISGLETPDDHTLVVRLTEPTGDLADRFALPATAPIPAGAADGHLDDYFRYLVSSGPYMIEGSENLDFGAPAEQQVPVSGFVVKTSISLVRDPLWSQATDELRAAYPDRIEIELASDHPGVVQELARRIDSEALDLDLVYTPGAQVARYRSDPSLQGRVHTNTANVGQWIYIDLAMPPFDDVHVRRALALILDRQELAQRENVALHVPATTHVTWHIVPDGVEGGLLSTWQPAWARGVGDHGSVAAAKQEMSRSPYDANGDGRCDGAVCHGVPVAGNKGDLVWEAVEDSLWRLGISLDVRVVTPDEWAATIFSPAAGYASFYIFDWVADYPNASTFFLPLFTGASITEFNLNLSLLGATVNQLRAWGYDGRPVPTADDRISQCEEATGTIQQTCWARIDQYLMEEVVPVVPIGETEHTYVVSSRVMGYSFDQYMNLPALDRISLAPQST